MGTPVRLRTYQILCEEDLDKIHRGSLDILENIGVKVPHQEILTLLAESGARVDQEKEVARLPAELVEGAIRSCGKQHILYGRDRSKQAEFGCGMVNFQSSAGQWKVVDQETLTRRDPTIQDLRRAIILGDGLDNLDITGSFYVPLDVPREMRDLTCFLELLKNTTKPIIGWITYPRSAQLILEMMRVVAGGRESLKKYPPYEAFVEPVSPLQFTPEGLEILYQFARAELPIGFGPMVAVSATGPCTLAGAVAQENAEILAGITITQAITPGLPITYWGIPHLFDNRTGIMSFGSPEQGLMAAAITQLGKSYGFPVGNNTGLHDSKLPDAQAGVENGSTLILGLLAGGDILGHLGICGADNGGNEIQLVMDNETAGYIRRIGHSFEVNETTLALEVIKSVGIGGNFLAEEHTLRHFKDDVWFPSFFDRFSWDVWEKRGKKSSVDLAREIHQQILAAHQVEPLEEEMLRELEAIVEARRNEL